MHFKTLFFLLLFCSFGAAESLQRNYFVQGNEIMLSDIVKDPKENVLLYTIEQEKQIKRVSSTELIETLKRHTKSKFTSNYSYIQFNKKSNLDLQKIEAKLKEHYQNRYANIQIISLSVRPRGNLAKLPNEFTFGIQEKEHLSSSGYCFITTPQKRKVFFSYEIFAHVDVYYAREDIQKGSELSNLNLTKKSIMLSKFRSLPLQNLNDKAVEAKHRLKKDTLITSRDVVALYLVKRGESVNITLKSAGIDISFSAKALTSGRAGDQITVENREKRKIKVRVVGKNRAEM